MSENDKNNPQMSNESFQVEEVIKASNELAQAGSQNSGVYIEISNKTNETIQNQKSPTEEDKQK